MLIFISVNHYIPQSFIKALKMTCNSIVAWTKHLHFSVLKLIGLKIFRWVKAFIYLSNEKIIYVIHLFVIFPGLIALIQIHDTILRHILLINTIVTWLLLKISIIWPDINVISLKASFFSSNVVSTLYIIAKDIFRHVNFVCISNSLRNTVVNLSRCS